MDKKVKELLASMTLEEKISLLAGVDFWSTGGIERLNIPAIKMTDGPNGTRTMSTSGVTRLLSGNCYPSGVALAASWNTELINRVGAAIAEDAKAKGCSMLLGPCVNIHRSPLGGRNFESYSEDPYLASCMAVAIIKGIQGRQVSACVKHFAFNNSEYQRLFISSEVQERTMREIYLPAFEAAVKEAGTWAIMSSYNKVNGTWASENPYLLTDILKKEWAFDGVVVSDWGAVHSTVPTALAGLEIEMPGPARFLGDALLKAVKKGEVQESIIDDKVGRILLLMQRTGILERPRVPAQGNSDKPEYRRLAREAAGESIVLLKNNNSVLPLDKKRIRSIAVIGSNASQARVTGGGSAQVQPYYSVAPLQAIKELCGDSIEVIYEPGCYINRRTPDIDPEYFTPDGDAQGKGLTAHLFASDDLTGTPYLEETDTKISSMYITKNDPRSCRWTGNFTAADSGVYRFGVITDDFSRVSIGGELIIDKKTADSEFMSDLMAVEAIGEFRAEAGESYPVVIEYRANPAGRGILRRFRFGCEPPVPADLKERAVKAASEADVAVVFVGTSEEWETEHFDRENMDLPGSQAEIVERVAAVNPNTVVVLNNGAPLSMDMWMDKVAAVVEAWFPGQECGNAIAGVLFGAVNPSGKLPVTFPRRLEDNPAYINYPGEFGKVLYGEGIFVGYRYYEKKMVEPLFPFGYGLSYTTFDYSNLVLSKTEVTENQPLRVSIDVTNTGKRTGSEIVQLYIHDIESTVIRPLKELKGFEKVYLKPGEKKTVHFKVDMRSLSFYDPVKKEWTAEPGEYELLVGSSSRDIKETAIFRLE